MENKLKKFIRRYKYVANILICALGVIGLFATKMAFSPDTVAYDIGLSISSSAVATSVISIILLFILPNESDDEIELKTWGIVKVYSERGTATIGSNKLPRNNLDFIAFGLKHFRAQFANSEKLLDNIKNGLHIKILTLHPESKYVKEQQQLENSDGLKGDITDLVEWVEKMRDRLSADCKGSIEVRMYDNLPLNFYCRADSRIWVGPYPPGELSNNAITYEFRLDSKGGERYEQCFQDYWIGRKGVHIVDKNKKFLLGDQRQSIESVCKYFCRLIQGSGGDRVVGVVVLFKKSLGLRRTLFSCNKKDREEYHCYKIDEGAVGKLISLNEEAGSGKVLFFRDYAHDLSIVFRRQGRDLCIKKIDFHIRPFKPDTDMNANLSVPIYDQNDMIGAVTFDIHNFSNEYMENLGSLENLAYEETIDDFSNTMCKWFRIAETCANMVSHMLGDTVNIEYSKLYDEEWTVYEN